MATVLALQAGQGTAITSWQSLKMLLFCNVEGTRKHLSSWRLLNCHSSVAPELVMAMNWRKVAEGRPDTPLPCRLYDTYKRVRSEEEQQEAATELAHSLVEFICSKNFAASLLGSSTCPYVDTQFGRAPRGSAMEVQLALHTSNYKRLISLERGERGLLASPTPFSLCEGTDQ